MHQQLRVKLQSLCSDKAGNFAVTTALLTPVLFAAASVAINLTSAVAESDKIQAALDAAAIAAVKSYGEGETETEAQQHARSVFFGNFAQPSIEAGAEDSPPVDESAFDLTFSAVDPETRATASYSSTYDPIFWGLAPYNIARTSVAARVPDREVCILALHHTASRAVEVSGSSTVDTSNCTITSNSNSAQSIYLSGTATLKSACLYTAGRVAATLAHLELACGEAREGTARAPDPFKSKVLPRAQSWVSLEGCGQNFVSGGGGNGDCNGTGRTPNRVPEDYSVTLKPGTYGSLEIKGKVSLLPGNYIIDGGALNFTSQSVVAGENVTFFLLRGANVGIHGGATFRVSAPLTGDWAGFSLVAARDNPEPAVINGNSASSLTGIIYMPASQEIRYAGNGATEGECVRVIAQEITMIGNSSFKLDCEQEFADNKINNPGAIRLVE
jgi:hypothetical protein